MGKTYGEKATNRAIAVLMLLEEEPAIEQSVAARIESQRNARSHLRVSPSNAKRCLTHRVGELPSLRGSSLEFGEGIPNSWLDGFRRAKPSPL